jgi:hypothetical protein
MVAQQVVLPPRTGGQYPALLMQADAWQWHDSIGGSLDAPDLLPRGSVVAYWIGEQRVVHALVCREAA